MLFARPIVRIIIDGGRPNQSWPDIALEWDPSNETPLTSAMNTILVHYTGVLYWCTILGHGTGAHPDNSGAWCRDLVACNEDCLRGALYSVQYSELVHNIGELHCIGALCWCTGRVLVQSPGGLQCSETCFDL